MRDIRSADELRGLWSAIPMPWTTHGRLDVGMLERNIERLAAVPCDGIYTTDSDGEFYALELDEFREFVAAFAGCMADVDCGAQVGATWTNTQGVIDRIKVCLDHGISTVHVAYPYWMPLNHDDVARFWDDLAAAAPGAHWVHYNTPRAHVRMTGRDYHELARRFPDQFLGTKLATQNFVELAEVLGHAPGLSHFVTDYMAVPGAMLGARGVYSFWVNVLPTWQRRLLDHCAAGRWSEAADMQQKLNCWESAHIEPLVARGYLHAVVGKARGACSGFLEDAGYTRAPYQPVPVLLGTQLTADFRRAWSAELANERWGSAHGKLAAPQETSHTELVIYEG